MNGVCVPLKSRIMKAIILSIYMIGACSLAASAQSKTAETTMDMEAGYGKYMEIQPLAVKPSKKNKKLELRRDKHRIEPVSDTIQDVVAINRKKSKSRIEGKLVDE